MDKNLDTIEEIATALGQIEVSSNLDRRVLKDLCAKAITAFDKAERNMEIILVEMSIYSTC